MNPTIDPIIKFSYKLDPFQEGAINALLESKHVLVTAHTSAGKSTVAEFAIAQGIKLGKRVIYTSPIKALSNQKYSDFKGKCDKGFFDLPSSEIGLLTGDIKVNPEAKVLIATTEILRNMLLQKSLDFDEIYAVVFDEVHYIRDPDRGRVWEESIVLLPNHILLVMLSASIPNGDVFAAWVTDSKKRETILVSTDYRPVPLHHYIYWNRKNYLQMDNHKNYDDNAYINVKEYIKLDKKANKGKDHTKPRILNDLSKFLEAKEFLPALIFCFSRKKCEVYAGSIHNSFLDGEEKNRVSSRFKQLIRTNLGEKGFQYQQTTDLERWLDKGIAVHHSGLLPMIKEIVEVLFAEGFIKILFVTETFAVGINLPAKSVVFAEISKRDGGSTAAGRFLKPHEYIQMAGRAGRRGLDHTGTVMLALLEPNNIPELIDIKDVLLGSQEYIRSRFEITPSFLVKSLATGGDSAEIANRSLAYYEAENTLIFMRKEINILEKDIAEYEKGLTPEMEEIVTKISGLEAKSQSAKQKKQQNRISKEIEQIRIKFIEDHPELESFDSFIGEFQAHKENKTKAIKLLLDYENTINMNTIQTEITMDFLDKYGYLQLKGEGEVATEILSPKGVMLSQVDECDGFLLVESYKNGHFDNLTDQELAAVLAIFIVEREDDNFSLAGSELLNKKVKERIASVRDLNTEISDAFQNFRIYRGQCISVNMAECGWCWCTINPETNEPSAQNIEEVLNVLQFELYPGNFVRAMLRLYNILEELVKVCKIDNNPLQIQVSRLQGIVLRDIIVPDSLYIK